VAGCCIFGAIFVYRSLQRCADSSVHRLVRTVDPPSLGAVGSPRSSSSSHHAFQQLAVITLEEVPLVLAVQCRFFAFLGQCIYCCVNVEQ